MRTHSTSRPLAVLVLGDVAAAQQRADQLRLRGFATFIAQDESELSWLLGVAQIRPTYAVVDLSSPIGPGTSRVLLLVGMARLAAIAGLPVVLVGAEEDDARFFRRVLALFPCDPGNTAILSALPRTSAG
ncbi:MAG TPA: hypothetical protein VM261_25950 [Kofleriaceae bacterium]|nr:hypothetical protein [Kofleriaceae bacterium]